MASTGEFYQAVLNGNTERVGSMLAEGFDPSLASTTIGPQGDPPRIGDISQTGCTWTPLVVAVAARQIGAMELLMAAGADVDAPLGDQGTVLHAAIRLHGANPEDSYYQVVEALLTGGARLGEEPRTGYQALTTALWYRQVAIAELLLIQGADPNASSYDGYSPLALAVAHNSPRSIRLLIQYGADPHLPNCQGQSAFDFAVQMGHPELVELLQAGSRPAPE
jgi:ankyrin repeat protein